MVFLYKLVQELIIQKIPCLEAMYALLTSDLLCCPLQMKVCCWEWALPEFPKCCSAVSMLLVNRGVGSVSLLFTWAVVELLIMESYIVLCQNVINRLSWAYFVVILAKMTVIPLFKIFSCLPYCSQYKTTLFMRHQLPLQVQSPDCIHTTYNPGVLTLGP